MTTPNTLLLLLALWGAVCLSVYLTWHLFRLCSNLAAGYASKPWRSIGTLLAFTIGLPLSAFIFYLLWKNAPAWLEPKAIRIFSGSDIHQHPVDQFLELLLLIGWMAACLMVMLWPLILPKLMTYYIGHKIGTKAIERAQAEQNIKAKEEREKETIAEQRAKERHEQLDLLAYALEEENQNLYDREELLRAQIAKFEQEKEEYFASAPPQNPSAPALVPRSARWEHRINASPRLQRLENEE